MSLGRKLLDHSPGHMWTGEPEPALCGPSSLCEVGLSSQSLVTGMSSLSKVPRGSVGLIEPYLQNTGFERLWDFTNLESSTHRL